MVMSLKDYVNIILVKYRCQLGTKDHTVCIRVIQAGAVDILMNGHDTPFGIREVCNCFLNGLLMFCYIVVVCI